MQCVHGDVIYTGKKIVENAYVVFDGSTVNAISAKKRGELAGEFAVITPAFIDAHSHIGMARFGEPSGEGETNDRVDPIQPLADPLDSIQMDDAGIRDAAEMGVLYSCVVPGSGNVIGGRSAVIRHAASNTTDALVRRAGIKAAFGFNPMSTHEWKGTRPTTRMGHAALLRARLEEVRRKIDKQKKARGKKKDEVEFTAAEEVLRDVLTGRERLRVHVHKIDDIAALLRMVDEFDLRITVEHACDVHKPETFVELKRRGIPVTYGPVDAFPYKTELKHDTWRNIRLLLASGVDFGLMTDHPVVLSRDLLLQTRWFLRCGLTKQDAIEIITRRNATLLGLDDILGTLAHGRWASFTGWSGDPFDLASHPEAVYAEGERLYAE